MCQRIKLWNSVGFRAKADFASGPAANHLKRLTLTGLGKIKSAGSSRSTAHFSASAAAASYALSWPRRELPFRAVLEPVLFLKSLVFCRVFGM